jgi:hypothetical protein
VELAAVAGFRAHGFGGFHDSRTVQPRCEGAGLQPRRFSGEQGKDRLRDIVCDDRRSGAAEGDSVDHPHVALHQFLKSRAGTLALPRLKEFVIFRSGPGRGFGHSLHGRFFVPPGALEIQTEIVCALTL